MFNRILVPTDFSKPSDAALAHARRLADSTGATLHVLHVVDNLFLRAVPRGDRPRRRSRRTGLTDPSRRSDHADATK